MASSFRDPDGCVVTVNIGSAFCKPIGERALNAFLASETANSYCRQAVGPTYPADLKAVSHLPGLAARGFGDGGGYREICAVLEHERIAFQSFPYEWPPEMLHAAGALTLDLAESALTEGFGLKDATPYNILFRATKPVFVDLLSFENETGIRSGCLTRSSFAPLSYHCWQSAELGRAWSKSFLRDVKVWSRKMCTGSAVFPKIATQFLTLASIPTWLATRSEPGKDSMYSERRLARADQATFVLERLFRRLRQQLGQSDRAGRIRPEVRLHGFG
jgi:hypothetical protein